MNAGDLIGPIGGARGTARLQFVRHLVEMLVAMVAGMFISAAIFLAVVSMTVDQALRQHPVLFVIVQAAGMTAPMVAWMRHRGHLWRPCAEMGGAMILPAGLLIGLRTAHAIDGPICGSYCALALAAMVVVMLYRRDEYGMRAAFQPAGRLGL